MVERDAGVGLRSSRAEPPKGEADSPVAELRGRRLLLARMGWITTALFVAGLFAAAVPVSYGEISDLSNLPAGIYSDALRENLSESGISAGAYAMFRVGMEVGFALVCLALAVEIFRRRSEEPVALFVSLLLVLLGTTFWGSLQTFAAVYPAWRPVAGFLDALGIVSLFLFFYLFPDGRFVPRWTRWLAAAALAHVALMTLFPASPLNPDNFPAPVFLAFLAGVLLTGMYAQVHRYRRVSGQIQRQQTKWVVFGFTAAIGGFLGVILFAEVMFSLAEPGTAGDVIGSAAITLFMLLIPLSIGVAIMRHRLFDIDVLINRTLVYGVLTACVVGIYILVVGYLGAMFQTGGNLAISLVATGVVAVIFAPLRERLQRTINRLMYGERDDPYAVISRLGRRLEGTLAPEAVMPAIADDVSRALRIPQTSIWLADGDTLRLEASHGEAPATTAARDPGATAKLRHAPDGLHPADLDASGEYGTALAESGADLVLPLTHRGELVGAISLAPRSPGEEFSPSDRRLLRDVATQASAAAHAVRLTVALRSSLEDLRQSRERLVAAQEEERRRIQRDLHDGLGPVLASMRLRLEACLDTQANGESSEAPLTEDLERLYELVGQATGDIRRLVHDLRPPVLDQLGLVPALRQHCERFHRETGIVVNFEAEENLPVPAAAEAAILRVAQESLLNVEKHARASRVDVHLERGDGWLSLEVRDNGVGMDESRNGAAGTGVGGMRERADLLGGEFRVSPVPGGGTEVAMRIPAPDREAVR